MKLALGTAQFGLDYGINNKKGKVPKTEVFKILKTAFDHGVTVLDTAYGYGESEKVIGEFISEFGSPFHVISKSPSLDQNGLRGMENKFYESLERLNLKRISGYLIHQFKDYQDHPEMWDLLERLKQKGLINNIGFSLYLTQDLETILRNSLNVDMIQIPYSLFDRRFESFFSKLKQRGTKIFARSVFLQGLVFLQPNDLPSHLRKARATLEKLKKMTTSWDVPINALCLNFALFNPYVDYVIIGVDHLRHFKKNLEDQKYLEKLRDLKPQMDPLKIEDEDLLLPYQWGKK